MTRLLGLALGAAVASLPAMADVQVTGFFSQRLDAETDNDRGEDEDDPVFRSATDLGLVFSFQDARTSFTVAPGLQYSLESNDDRSELERLNPRLNVNLNRSGLRSSVNGSFSIVPRFTDRDSVDTIILFPVGSGLNDPGLDDVLAADDETATAETGEVTRSGTVIEIVSRANLGASYRLDPTRTVSGNVFVVDRRFDEDDDEDLLPTTTFGAGATFSQRLSPITTVNLSPSATYFTEESDDNTRTLNLGLSAGGSTRLSPLTGVSGNIGGAWVSSESDGEDAETSFNLTGGINLDRRLAEGGLAIGFNQSVQQQTDGEIVNSSALSASLNHRFSPFSTGDVSASYRFNNPLLDDDEDADEVLALGAGFSHTLSPDWTARIGYQLRVEDVDNSNDDNRLVNLVFIQISRNFALLQ